MTVAAAAPSAGNPLQVGIAPFAPFTMKNAQGRWEGISVELWENIARQQQWNFIYRELSQEEMVAALTNRSLDAAITPIPITFENETLFDFSHFYYSSGLGVAVAARSVRYRWLALLRDLFSVTFLQLMFFLGLNLLLAGFIIWFFERKRNSRQFGGPARHGLGAGIWWAAVTLSTVGYGDKVPVTLGGRLAASIWFFAGVLITSSVTGHIASTLTMHHLQSVISGPEDLVHHRVAILSDGPAEVYLREHQVKRKHYPSEAAALAAVARGEVAAFVAPAPMLRHVLARQMNDGLRVLPFTLDRMEYAFALPDGSPLRETLNRALLRAVSQPVWPQILSRYLEE
ncbi:MAG: transporter substrate-binding domain-containing protein [Limisphaerales bacterium]